MLFVATCLDKADSLTLRLATRPAHLAYLKGLGDRVRLGGALLAEDRQSAVGSMLILKGESEAEVHGLLADDPYAKAGLFATVEVKPWRQAVGVELG